MNILAEDFSETRFLERGEPSSERLDPFHIGALRVNPRTGEVNAAGKGQRLRRKELELLTCLYRSAGTVLTRDKLLREVWKAERMVTRTVDQTVATLRRKIGDSSESPKFLLTIYGVGYQFVPDAS